jgi:hypothetical protein
MSKISKQAVLYLHKAGTQYECKDCVFYRDGICALFSGNATVKPFGSCGLWTEKKPGVIVPRIATVTKTEAGYVENEQGFSCKRCEEFILSGDCEKVDKDSPGDDPGMIHKNACCARFELDKKRGSMTTSELINSLGTAR